MQRTTNPVQILPTYSTHVSHRHKAFNTKMMLKCFKLKQLTHLWIFSNIDLIGRNANIDKSLWFSMSTPLDNCMWSYERELFILQTKRKSCGRLVKLLFFSPNENQHSRGTLESQIEDNIWYMPEISQWIFCCYLLTRCSLLVDTVRYLVYAKHNRQRD